MTSVKICVPRGQQALWISRVQAGVRPLALKIPLEVANGNSRGSATDLNSLLTDSDEEQEVDVSCSSSEQELDTKKDSDWDIVDKGCAIDEFLCEDSEDSDEGDDMEGQNHESLNCGEDAFSGTKLGAIVATAQRIIELSNTTAKKQVTTNKQKQQWWDNRKKLDSMMREVVNNLEASVLGWRKAILVPPPSDKYTRDALKKVADTLESEMMQVINDNSAEEDTERKSSRAKLAGTRAKSKSAPKPKPTRKTQERERPAISPINRPLLEVFLGAIPYLTDSEICEALGFITGRVMEHKWATTVRGAYDNCIGVDSVTEGKQRSSTKEDAQSDLERQTLILALDGKLQRLPWESLSCLDTHSVTRVPSLLYANILYNASSRLLRSGINAKRAFYLLNAEGDLAKTQECFEVQFKRRLGWQGLVGIRPTADEYKHALTEHDLFVYCGHGSGEQYLKRDAVARLPKCGVALLMGCSSGFLCDEGDFEPAGMANSFLVALSPSVVGNLWDVTDGELDRLTKALLMNWLDQGLPLPLALAQARKTCQFRFLVAAAAVCYGVPVRVSS
jgi:hypothetical protein